MNKPVANVFPLFLFCGMFYVCQASWGPYLNTYFSGHGISVTSIGVLTAAAAITSLLSQFVWSTLSDKTGLRRMIPFVLSLGTACCMLFFRHSTSFSSFFVFILLFYFFQSAIHPLTDSIITKSAKEKHVDFSWIRLTGTLSYSVVVYLFGRMISSKPSSMFIIAAVCFAVLATCIAALPGERLVKKEADVFQFANEKKFAGKKDLIFVALGTLVVSMMNNFLYSYQGILVLSIGKTQANIGISQIISALSEIPILLLGRRMYKKFGIRMMNIAVLSVSIRLLFYSTGSIPMIYVGQVFQGASFMVGYYCMVMYLNEYAPPGQRARWFGVFGMLQTGFSALLGGLLGGAIIPWIGILATYRTYAITAIVITAILVFYECFFLDCRNKTSQ